MARFCVVEDCDRKHCARGLCRTHYAALYRRTRPAVTRAAEAKYRLANLEKYQKRRREYMREYRLLHPHAHRDWVAANRKQVTAYQVARAHLRRAKGDGDRFTVEEIAERDGWRCHICGKNVTRKTWSLDHLIPIVAGGPHTRTNVSLAHKRCNSRRGTGRIPAQLRLIG